MIPIAIGSFVLLVVVAYMIARPIFAPETWAPEAEGSAALADKQRLLADIRELDLDFATDKLEEDDYQRLRSDSLARAAEAARALDQARGPEPDPAPSQDPLEREIAARKRSMEDRGCPICGAIAEPEDRSCRGCRAQLATTGTG